MSAMAAVGGLVAVIAVLYMLLAEPMSQSEPQYTTHKSDSVFVIDDFLSAAECDEFIRMGTPNLKKSVQANAAGAAVEDSYRSSSSTRLPYLNSRLFKSLNRRMTEVSGLPPAHFQELQLARYENGQAYGLHRDEHQEGDRAGGRVATMLVYLSDVESGGETLFTREPLEKLDNLTKLTQKMVHFKEYCSEPRGEQLLVSPKKGRAVFWWTFVGESAGSDSAKLIAYEDQVFKRYVPNSTHGACPVRKGTKWVMQQWMTGEMSNAARLPTVLMHLPLGAAHGWAVGSEQAVKKGFERQLEQLEATRSMKAWSAPGLLSDQTGLHASATLHGAKARLHYAPAMIHDSAEKEAEEKRQRPLMQSSRLQGRCASVHMGAATEAAGRMKTLAQKLAAFRASASGSDNSDTSLLANVHDQGLSQPGQFSALVWFRLNSTAAVFKAKAADSSAAPVRLLEVSFPDPIGIEVAVGAGGLLHWVINGNRIPNGPHFPEMKVQPDHWYQVLLTSSHERAANGNLGQAHRLYLGALSPATYRLSRTYDPERPTIELLGKVGGPLIHSLVDAEAAVLGGCLKKGRSTMVDLQFQDFILLGSVVRKDQLRFLTRVAYQFARF